MTRGRVSHVRMWRASHPVRTQKEIICVGTWPGNLEYLHHVEELAVDVANNSDGCSYVYHITLLHEQLLCLCAYRLDHRLGE